MDLNRLDTEAISDLHYQVIGNHGHEGLTRSQGNPARKLPPRIYDVPNLVSPGRRPAHPQGIVQPTHEFEHQWVVSGKVNGLPRSLSQGLEYPLSQEFLRDRVLKPEFPVVWSDLETIVKG